MRLVRAFQNTEGYAQSPEAGYMHVQEPKRWSPGPSLGRNRERGGGGSRRGCTGGLKDVGCCLKCEGRPGEQGSDLMELYRERGLVAPQSVNFGGGGGRGAGRNGGWEASRGRKSGQEILEAWTRVLQREEVAVLRESVWRKDRQDLVEQPREGRAPGRLCPEHADVPTSR